MNTEIEITDASFDAKTASGVTMVDFWAPWCGPCKAQEPILEKVAEQMAGKAKVGKCNVDENQALARKFGIQSIPTILIFEDGKEIDRMVGVQQEDVLVG